MENGNVQVISVNRHFSSNAVAPEPSSTNFIPDFRSRTALLRKKIEHDRKFTITLFVICVLLAVTVIILACTYIFTRNRAAIKVRICQTDECIRSAANLKLAMNTSVDPCDNFYEFTCGKWTSEHPDHGWFMQNSPFALMEEKIVLAALKFLQSNVSAREPKPVKQTRSMYEACMDAETLNKLGYQPIFKYLDQLGLPAIPSFMNMTSDVNPKFNWINTEAAMTKLLALQLFIGIDVEADPSNTTKNCIVMGVPTMRSPLPSPLKDGKKKDPYLKSNNDEDDESADISASSDDFIMFAMKQVILANVTDVPEDIDDRIKIATEVILKVYAEIDEFHPVNESTSDTYVTISADSLQNSTNKMLETLKFDAVEVWKPLIRKVFEGTNVVLDLEKKDYIHLDPNHVEYLLMIVGFLSGMPEVVIELWVWWMTVNALIMNTTTEIREFVMKQSSPSKNAFIVTKSVNCAILVNDFMGMAVSYALADSSFLNDTKPKIQQMLGDIKDAFATRVKTLTWMDDVTKQVTLEKSNEMASYIGFPEWLLQDGNIESYYQNAVINNNTHLDNMVEIIKLSMKGLLESLHEVNGDSWHSDPITVNAYNFFLDNSITIPMAVLLFPMYHLGLEVLNYGAIGSVLGHELTHGFDNTGRKYDKHGNYRQWWSNSTVRRFENLTRCFVDHYSQFHLAEIDKNVDGNLTLGENIADNGGIHHAYLAYRSYVARRGPEPALPGFEHFTHDQLFFIAFGSVWCDDANAATLQYQVLDEHSPNRVRVLGTLRNSEEFAKAFDCPAGSYMNPAGPHCRIW